MEFTGLSLDRDVVRATSLLLLAVALAGIAHLAFLPPFEGFDEAGHFSYIQQIADTGQIPHPGANSRSADVDAYPGPRSYSGVAPFDQVSGVTFKEFFAGPLPGPLGPVERTYQPGNSLNGESQHPPLFYLLLVPLYLLGRSWSWPALLLLLRSASWALAFTGFAVGCLATQRQLRPLNTSPPLLLLVPAWPFLFPQFFPEMARLGNDSLCLFLAGIAWALLPRLLERKRPADALLMGVILGLGLLTKAFFLGITGGLALFLVFVALKRNEWSLLRIVVMTTGVAVALGGAWYTYELYSTGSLTGARDVIAAARQGNLGQRMIEGFSLLRFLQGIGQITVSFAWAGTLSFNRFPPIYTLPMILLALLPSLEWLRRLARLPITAAAPLFIAGPFILGLAYFRLTQMARDGEGTGTPGWYLHMLAGPLAFALVLGWRWRRVLAGLALYALGFHAFVWTMQLSLFSGCAYKAGTYKYTQFDLGGCLIVPERLAVLGYPLLGGMALAAALALAGGGTAWFFLKRRPPEFPPSAQGPASPAGAVIAPD